MLRPPFLKLTFWPPPPSTLRHVCSITWAMWVASKTGRWVRDTRSFCISSSMNSLYGKLISHGAKASRCRGSPADAPSQRGRT